MKVLGILLLAALALVACSATTSEVAPAGDAAGTSAGPSVSSSPKPAVPDIFTHVPPEPVAGKADIRSGTDRLWAALTFKFQTDLCEQWSLDKGMGRNLLASAAMNAATRAGDEKWPYSVGLTPEDLRQVYVSFLEARCKNATSLP